ncbi:MAG: transcription elongation factor GreB [Xanthomonadales bacterium]|nr:transcription elongation factor GreB [Xanthomonadales bacterium]
MTRSAPYITPEGYQNLKQELDYLWRELRPEVTRAVTAAAAEGDRSENAEYIYRKKQLREIDRRVRYLGKRLDVLKVVREKPRDQDAVFFGARVTLEDAVGDTRRYRIVGSDESNPAQGSISVDSPLARALLKKRVDDEVMVELPRGQTCYVIVDVQY